jgi:hypothetical protein
LEIDQRHNLKCCTACALDDARILGLGAVEINFLGKRNLKRFRKKNFKKINNLYVPEIN